ncbi:MAG TPA: hypothetical protein PL096_07185 [Micropepsaceae bacterium]|nr:hypothetical protein [Micropepsaceae bacterium]
MGQNALTAAGQGHVAQGPTAWTRFLDWFFARKTEVVWRAEPSGEPPPSLQRVARASSRIAALDLEVQEAVADGLSAIENALLASDTVRAILKEALDLAEDAATIPDLSQRALLAERYGALREGVNRAAELAGFGSVNLANGSRTILEIALDRAGKARHAVRAVDLTNGPKGFDLPEVTEEFTTSAEIAAVRRALENALTRVDRAAAVFLDDSAVLVGALPEADPGAEAA